MEWTELKVHEFINAWCNLPCCKTSHPTIMRCVAAPFGVRGCHCTTTVVCFTGIRQIYNKVADITQATLSVHCSMINDIRQSYHKNKSGTHCSNANSLPCLSEKMSPVLLLR